MTKTLLAAAAATGLLCLASPVLAKTSPAPIAPVSTAQIEQSRFTVEVMGKGPDVILIPGLSTPREVWRPTAEALKDRYRVHLVQLRGFGDAAGVNAAGPVLEPFVTELAAYAATLKRPAVIGHSLGGLAALQLAARHPDAAGKVMVVDAVPFIGTLFDPAATSATAGVIAGRMRDGMLSQAKAARNAPRPAPRDCSALTGESPVGMGAMSVSAKGMCQIGNWMLVSAPEVVAQAMYDDMVSDERESIARITIPLTVLHALDTRDPRHAETAGVFHAAYAKAPKARLVPIEGAAHFTMLDQFDKTLAEIQTFLR